MKLFEPGKIGKMALKNRITMAPMGTRLHEPDGRLSQRGVDYYTARARGGAALIATSGFNVMRRTAGGATTLVFYPMVDDKMYITRLSELAEAVHDFGAKLSIQLLVEGGRTNHSSIKSGGAVAPSVLPCFFDPSVMTREITIEEIQKQLRAYQFGAEVCREAGVDAIDIHGHKGGFVDQFMTSLWNKRTDEYGGSLENRLRYPVEIIRAIKKGAGADCPVIFRYGLTHYMPGGRDIDEGVDIARRLEAAGADALLIDAGCEETIFWIHPPTTLPPGCMVDLAEKVKKAVSIPVIAVGKLGYPDLAERVLQEGKADFIALGRPLLADPDWPNKVRQGRLEDIRPCLGDNEGCEARVATRRYLSCTVNPAVGMEKEFTITPAAQKKTVLVVGGGPGGMEAAIVSAQRGHKVTLWEKTEALGGNLVPAAVPGFKQDYRRLIDYMVRQVKKLGVAVELGKEATPSLVKRAKPDVVFVATGGKPIVPNIPGVNRVKVVGAIDVLLGKKKAGKSAVVVGGGTAGSEVALYLAQAGKRVTIVEMLDGIALGMYHRDNRQHLAQLLDEAGVTALTKTSVLEITAEGVTVQKDGKKESLKADTVVLAVGLEPNDKLSKALADSVPEVYTIGDCVEPRKVINAIWEGFRIGRVV